MNFKKLTAAIIFLTILGLPGLSLATHPLVTDDTGTQGRGNFQLELNGQHDSKKDSVDGVSTITTGGQATAALSYGIVENADLILSLPYQWGKTEENELSTYDEKGFSDTVLEVKWRFWEKEGYSLALKPGISFPTGNEEKDLGTGKAGGHLFLIGSRELGPWTFHANLGYIRNENKADERENIWHASLATTWEAVKNLKFVANIGIERNHENEAKDDPAFILGGLIYSVTKNLDLDCGVKYGLNSSATDLSLMAGITIRFQPCR